MTRFFSFFMGLAVAILTVSRMIDAAQQPRCVMYLTGQHNVVPNVDQLRHVSHVALAFMNSATFNDDSKTEWPLFTSVVKVRTQFAPGTKVMVAIGGWGDTAGFSEAARSEEGRSRFARNVARMVEATGADGVDIDWEYPGGNGEDYREVPNSAKAWEIDAYPLLVSAIRHNLGGDKLISAAVPGLERDMLAFTHETVPRILQHINFFNVMTYDLMNRRDNMTKHHTGLQLSVDSLDAYLSRGASPTKLNLGFAFYVKYFRTEHDKCRSAKTPVGCPTLLLEDPKTGADLGRTGGFSYHDEVPQSIAASFEKAKTMGTYDNAEGGYYYWDEDEDLWWTLDNADAIARKFPEVVAEKKLGGVFAWGLGEDAPKFEHLEAVTKGLEELERLKQKESDSRSEL